MLRLILFYGKCKKLVRTFRFDIDALNTSISFYIRKTLQATCSNIEEMLKLFRKITSFLGQ